MSIPQKLYERIWEGEPSEVPVKVEGFHRWGVPGLMEPHFDIESSQLPRIPRQDERIWRAVRRRTGRFAEAQRKGESWPV